MRLTDYQQLFSTQSMSFLMSDIFIRYYKQFDGLAVLAHDKWTSFLPKRVVEKTLDEGLKLLSDKELFLEYTKGIEEYYATSAQLFEKILSKPTLDKESAQAFLEKMTENFYYYSKTEFFYVDKAHAAMKDNPLIAEHISKLEEIKNKSRLKVNKMFFEPDAYRRQFMAKVGAQFGLTKDEVSMYGIEDILGLFSGTRLAVATIQDRDRSYLMLSKDGIVEYKAGLEAEKTIDDFFAEAQTDTKEYKGTVTSKGKVRARATVIHYGDDMFSRLGEVIRQMPQGNILVADTTSPELMLACKKASAILTNQGGLMSHAAIVSRELGIPCIVGLKNITDVIKDGDMVEVDAEKGIVRKI